VLVRTQGAFPWVHPRISVINLSSSDYDMANWHVGEWGHGQPLAKDICTANFSTDSLGTVWGF
jgi:hypothetical protein